VTIGASRSSFGWYYQNRKEDSGNKVLHIEAGMDAASESIADVMLPGTSMNTNWLTSMIKLGEDNAGRAGLCQPDVRHYRRKQILYTVLLRANGAVAREQLDALRSQLDAREQMVYALLLPLVYLGAPGRRALSFLHVASQKRSGYLWHALVKRLFKRAPVTRFTHDADILDTEVLLGRRS
jgi:hypothetical protein